MVRKLDGFTIGDATKIWDTLAEKRFDQITSGRDLTFSNVLAPALVNQINFFDDMNILDAGCGTGVLSKYLFMKDAKIVGIDPSTVSIEIARSNFSEFASFYPTSIESFSKSSKVKFDVIVANMVLMDAPNLNTFLTAARKLSHERTVFSWTATHPFFWPKYSGYEAEPWFNYRKEIFVEDVFRISKSKHPRLSSVHVHRPLEMISKAFVASGWTAPSFAEPWPDKKIQKLYPQPWKFPRYILGRSLAK